MKCKKCRCELCWPRGVDRKTLKRIGIKVHREGCMYRSGGDLSALSYCNYEDVMDVLLETIGRHSCSLEKDMGLQSPVYNLRILNVLKES